MFAQQLELESETGIFHIKDVPLNCSAINELLIGSAVCICSASVADLTVTVSWAAISDGCKITLNGVRFALCKANNSTTQQPARSSGCATHGSAGVATAPISPTVEEEGVLFLANWIDIVVARFHVELKNIEIEMSGGGMHALQVMIDELHYFNSKPESSGSVASSAVEEALHSISRVPQSIYRTEGRLNPAMTSIAMMSSQEANKSKVITTLYFCGMHTV